jgi:hypothetical protein
VALKRVTEVDSFLSKKREEKCGDEDNHEPQSQPSKIHQSKLNPG